MSITVASRYSQLIAALRNRRKALGFSCAEVDHRGKLQAGYTNKMENYDQSYGRHFGPATLEKWMAALDVKIIIATDVEMSLLNDCAPDDAECLAKSMSKVRTKNQLLGSFGGKKRASKLQPHQRKEIARRAARKRWADREKAMAAGLLRDEQPS